MPSNALTRNAYRGINVVSLWVSAELRGYATPIWATYRQWSELGAQVRKGERSTLVIFYKEYESEPDPTNADDNGKRRVARASYVFNADQVDGFTLPVAPKLLGPIERLEAVDRFVTATGARVEHGGDRAFYRPTGALPSVVAPGIGLENVTLKSRAYYNDSETGNTTNADTAYAWVGKRRRKVSGVWSETFSTDEFEDWCRSTPESALGATATQDNTICYEGGYGSKEAGQADVGVQAQLRGNVLLGNFLIGGEARSVEGHRGRPRDFNYYSTFGTATGDTAANTPPLGHYECAGADACTEDEFARIRIVSSAYNVSETINALHGYAELDQTLGWFNVRAGARVDYEDYFKNINVAPRLVGSITPIDGVSFTGGYNRYYLGETLYYALRDSQPFALSWTRKLISGTSTPDEWVPPAVVRRYSFKSSDLDTPFTDEYTGGVRIRDPLLGGTWRVRYLERYGRDQFATESCGSNCYALNNDAESFYRSATAEYSKFWRTPSTPFLNAAGITVGATWSEESMSETTYIDDDESDEYILYKGKSYTRESYTAVTGNLDIPVRIGATLSTSWFSDRLWLDVSAGYNLGYQGVYDTGANEIFNGRDHDVYEDKKFNPVLLIDLDAQLMVTEQAYISARINNVFNTAGNKVSTNDNPWVLGRTVWLESGLRF